MAHETISVTAIRRVLAGVLHQLHRGDTFELTSHGRTVGYMVPPEWFERADAALSSATQNDSGE